MTSPAVILPRRETSIEEPAADGTPALPPPVTQRVLFVNHAAVPGGAELSLIDVVRWYRETSTAVLFAEGPLRHRLDATGIPVHVIDVTRELGGFRRESTLPSPRVVLTVARLVRSLTRLARRHDVIYANSQKAFVVASAVSALVRKPLIWHLHDILSPEHFSRANRRLAVFLANRFASRVLANSEAAVEAFLAAGGQPEKIFLACYGFDPRPFLDIADVDAAQERERLGLQNHPVVGIFSRLAPWKGQHVLLEALAGLPGVHALLVGDALFGEDLYARELRESAKARGVADRVHFLGFRSDVPLLMRLVDVVLHTSTSAEPFGRVIVEGMLAGRPVVATRAGGATEIVRDGATGLLVTPGDAGDLTVAIRSLLDDPQHARTLAARARQDALERFSLDAMREAITRHVREVVGA